MVDEIREEGEKEKGIEKSDSEDWAEVRRRRIRNYDRGVVG